MPFVEPSFGDIEPMKNGDTTPEVQGVCHLITEDEYDGIMATEGGGGVTKNGYHTVHVEPVPLRGDKTPIKCVTLIIGENPSMKFHGKLGLPSRRYINLLSEGAKHFELDPEYVEWLETHDSYDRMAHLPNAFARTLALIGVMMIALPVMPFFALNGIFQKKLPKHINYYWLLFAHTIIHYLRILIWAYHDIVVFVYSQFGWVNIETGGSKGVRCSPKPRRKPLDDDAKTGESTKETK